MANVQSFPEGNIPVTIDSDRVILAKILNLLGGSGHAAAITPDNSNDLANPSRVYVGTAGAVKVDTVGGDTVTFGNVPAGTSVPVQCRRVYATGTTASNLIAVY